MKRLWLVMGMSVFASWVCGAVGAVPLNDLETVKARLLAEGHKTSPNMKNVRNLIRSQRADGSWTDIDYGAKERMIWRPMTHLERLLDLAQAFESGQVPEAERDTVSLAFVRGFDFWVAHDPKSANWWYNEIGAPLEIYRMMLLAEPLLTDGRIERGCALLSRARLEMTGQNLLWLAECVIGRACLQRDVPLLVAAFQRLQSEILVTEKEGVQPDFSFHQHGAQFYSGGYGSGFAASAPRFALLSQGTSFAFPQDKVGILVSYLLDGQQWMIRGDVFDYSASGREPTRPNSGSSRSYASRARALLELEAVPRREELEQMAARIEKNGSGAAPAFTGHKHFWRADYTAHHRPEFMVSVRMTSERLLQTEIVNEENQLGEHLSDGVMYVYRTGNEYRNIFPVWDWARLPGITVEHDRPLKRINNRRKGTCGFVGGVSDGVRGVSAMDFERDGLAAKKAWFFFENEVVCLGAGISSANGYRVITSVNQCLSDGPVTVKRAGGTVSVLPVPEKVTTPEWAHHGGVGYVFLDAGESVGLGTSIQTGSWKRISAPQKADPVSQEVFSLWVNHGKHPLKASYAYVVTTKPDAASTDAYASALPVHVVANTPLVQAVEQTRARVLQAAFYQAGSVTSGTWGTVCVDTPCLLMLAKSEGKTRVTVCNPRNEGGLVTLSAGGRAGRALLPTGAYKGKSVSLDL